VIPLLYLLVALGLLLGTIAAFVLAPALGLVVIGIGVCCVLWGIVVERSWYRVVRYRLALLPAEGPAELTVLHLSDLHFVRGDRRKARFLGSLPKADVAIVTGDFLGEPEAVEAVVEGVRPVRGRLASWFVLGSNDHFEPKPLNYLSYFRTRRKHRRATVGRPRDLVGQLRDDGWRDLTNERLEINVDGLPVELLGLDDAHIRWHDLRVAPRRAPERFGLAVMHSPDSAPETAALGYDLLVAGHTHGGQVRVPGAGALVTNSTMPRRLASGLIRMGPAVLHTSPGLGTSRFAPFRFWCRPEATFLELSRRPEPSATAPAS
jgi:predicted MPP superfamily phosphohydrolase